MHHITKLDNGLTVVSERVPSVHSVALTIWVATGSRHEDDKSRGYAHFLEHLLFKGNERHDAADISRFFDGIGSDANAATTREYTAYGARIIDRHLGDALEMFGEMIFAPALIETDIDAEREVILEEIAMYDDSPSDVVHELADRIVFNQHSLGLPIIGSVESISTASKDGLRAFYQQHYHPANLVVSAAGAVDHDDLVQLIKTRLLKHSDDSARAQWQPHQLEQPPQYSPAYISNQRDTEQVHIVALNRGVSRRDERRHTAALLDNILGNAPSSRLFQEIREKRGLAYSVYSFFSNNLDSGEAGLYVGVRPDRVDEVMEVLRAELDRVISEPPSDAEVKLARGQIEGRMLLALESTVVRGNRLGAPLVAGLPIEPLEDTLRKINAVTADDIHELARTIFRPELMSLSIVAEDPSAVIKSAKNHGLLNGEQSAFDGGRV